jgi:hypothetical protein
VNADGQHDRNVSWFAWEARTQISNSDVRREGRQGADSQREEWQDVERAKRKAGHEEGPDQNG